MITAHWPRSTGHVQPMVWVFYRFISGVAYSARGTDLARLIDCARVVMAMKQTLPRAVAAYRCKRSTHEVIW